MIRICSPELTFRLPDTRARIPHKKRLPDKSSAYVGLLEGGRASIFHIHTRILGYRGEEGEGGCSASGCRGRRRWRRDAREGGGLSQWEGGYMTCHAVPGSPPPSSNHLSPSSLSPCAPRHPPGTPTAAVASPRPVPSSRHPLPHRSALMSGKNKTASPTAKAGVSPSPTTANDVVYRKEGGRGNRRRERRNGTWAPFRGSVGATESETEKE